MLQKNDYDIAIVGGGLFGCVIAKTLLGLGKSIAIFDSNKAGAGSKPAACLMKPGWFSGFSKEEVHASLDLLDSLYGLTTLKFKIAIAETHVYWVDPHKVLSLPKISEEVLNLRPGVVVTDQGTYKVGTTIVAAGVWCKRLLPRVGSLQTMQGKAGVAFITEGQVAPFIAPWAPYKQIVGFNIRPNLVWIGDGSSINQENWTDKREEASRARCAAHLPGLTVRQSDGIFGVRPYTPNAKPAFLQKVDELIWVATGGAKNGTIAAAWCANRLMEEMA